MNALHQRMAILMALCLAISFSLPHAPAASTVYVDFSPDMMTMEPWGGILDVLAAGLGAGFDPFSMMEVAELETIIMAELERIYMGFDVTFIPAPPPAAHIRDNPGPQ